MGFRFRRSLRVIPGVRLNLSRGGVSVSVGPRGLRYTVGPKGTRVTVGVPGTGLSWTQYAPHGTRPHPSAADGPNRPAPVSPINSDTRLIPIQSAHAERLNALSLSELAPILNLVQRRRKWTPGILLACIVSFGFSFASGIGEFIAVSGCLGLVFSAASIALDRYRRSVWIKYELQTEAATIATKLREGVTKLSTCVKVWDVVAKGNTNDWKRNAGASTLQQRRLIRPTFTKPRCIRGNVSFPALKLANQEIYFLPDAVLALVGGSVAALPYRQLSFSTRTIRFIEEDSVPSDTVIVEHTWRYVNKNGTPDKRFNFNKQLPICQYGEMTLSSEIGLNCLIQCSDANASAQLSEAIAYLQRHEPVATLKTVTTVNQISKWTPITFLSIFAGLQTLLVALAIVSFPNKPSAISNPNVAIGATQSKPLPISVQSSAASKPTPAAPTIPLSLIPNEQPATPNAPPLAEAGPAPYTHSLRECLSIQNVNQRVDCLETVHAENAAIQPSVSGRIARHEFKPSFDCAKTSTTIERAICDDDRLARLDAQLGSAYQRATSVPELRQFIIADQHHWLALRERECNKRQLGDLKACVFHLTKLRVNYLDSVAARSRVRP